MFLLLIKIISESLSLNIPRVINKKTSHQAPTTFIFPDTTSRHFTLTGYLSRHNVLGPYYICFFNKPLFLSMVMTCLGLLTNNTESYAAAFNLKVAEQKTSQTLRNTHPSHIAHPCKAMKSSALWQYKHHLVSLSDTSVYRHIQPYKHAHTYNVHYCQVKCLKLILNP